MENKEKPKSAFFLNFTLRDIFGLFIFLQIPLSFFLSNFISSYKIIYYAILVVFIITYTMVGQFFFEQQKLTSTGKKLIALTAINTIILSFIYFTGSLFSPYFFIIYFLIFTVALYLPPEMLVLECLIILGSIFSSELYKAGSIDLLMKSLTTSDIANLVSILIAIPVGIVIAAFVKNLQRKQNLLTLSKELIAVRDVEDEALLEEINQGVIILDPDLKIIKTSRWVEKNFKVSPQVLLGKNITDLAFYDTVSGKKLSSADYFYKNLTSNAPQRLSWKVNYKNQYGKYKKFVVKQTPLVAGNKVVGFMLSFRLPAKNVQDFLSSFNKLLNFRLSSSLVLLKNLLENTASLQDDPVYPTVEKHLELITETLNDTSLKNNITEGDLVIKPSTFDLKKLTEDIIQKLDPIRNIAVWNVSPAYKTQSVNISSDYKLCRKLISYAIEGALHLSRDTDISIAFEEDETSQRPQIAVTVNVLGDIPDGINVLEPFFAGRLTILAKYHGTGLELYNASLLASFLSFDFDAGISNNKLVVKITF